MIKRKNINSILKEVLLHVKPSEEEMKNIKEKLGIFLKNLEKNRKKEKINAELFVGGSFAKRTIIKKDSYDIDIFIRFDKKYKDELLSDITQKILKGEKAEKIHGSRDYFKVKAGGNIFFEVVPVKKVSSPKEAENVTDLSYSHVSYIKKKAKTEKLLDEIRIAKDFCYANGVYGAESYVHGFSGYGIELLIYHYKSFMNFVKAMAKVKDREIIDIEKMHKSKNHILMDLNEAKLKSPIILIDPTYRQRNVLAALSYETFRNFQKTCRDFIKNPSIDFFKEDEIDLEKIKKDSGKRGYDFLILKIETNRQRGDIAGSKLLKFYGHLCEEIRKFFDIKAKGFEYKGEKSARSFLVAKKKDGLVVTGPEVKDKENAARFKAKHNSIFIKNNRIYAKINQELSLKQFLEKWKSKNLEKIKDMSINKIEMED